MSKYVTIHGHFYQPPRENPWFGEIELQESASPWHDWNERINSECYLRNAAARILNDKGLITHIRNNYSRISFNFGPTLLSWMEKKAPLVLKAIQEADAQACERFSGHGTAIAQVYNHMIMPLANYNDKVTQVRWGMADFAFRFNRQPEGMWLAEAAVDTETLEVLTENGIKFTVLSPYQAQAIRKFGSDAWEDVSGGKIDTSRAYRCFLPSGRYIDVFFYNGQISQEIAFLGLLNNGGNFARKMLDALPNDVDDRLSHVATDGESYGHHHRHGDMALAYCLETLEKSNECELTVYGEFLEDHLPQYNVRIIENSSWSCAHGVERWRADCGCNTGKAGFNQKWRGPLRNALDWLRDSVKDVFETTMRDILPDPWGARDAYIELMLDPSSENVREWLFTQAEREITHDEHLTVLRLLEMQRNALLMYTSCGWFFDDMAGIETVQILCYASRVMDIAKEALGLDLEEEFKNRLALAPGNEEKYPNGRVIYEKLVVPKKVSPERLAAQLGIFTIIEPNSSSGVESNITTLPNGTRIGVGRISGESNVSFEQYSFFFAARLKKSHELVCGVKRLNDGEYEELCSKFASEEAFDSEKLMHKIFGEHVYSYRHLLKDMRQYLLTHMIEGDTATIEKKVRNIIIDYEDVLNFTCQSGAVLPFIIRNVVAIILNADLEASFKSDNRFNHEAVSRVVERAAALNIELDMKRICYAASAWLISKMHALEASFPNTELVKEMLEALEFIIGKYSWDLSLSETQNSYYRLISNRGLNNGDEAWFGDIDLKRQFIRIGELLRFSERILEE